MVRIYVLVGSPDPALATSKILLADLSANYSGDNSLWKDTMNLTIPNTAKDCYIAFKFVAIDGWSSISFDNLHVTMNKTLNTGIDVSLQNKVQVFPNPSSSGKIKIVSEINLSSLKIFNSVGQEVMHTKAHQNIDISSLPSGSYVIRLLTTDGKEIVKSILVK